MNREKARVAVVALIILVAGWIAYNHRVRIAAWFWHLRHGMALASGNYVVPVPANWYVDSKGDGFQLLVRADTDDNALRKSLKGHDSILLLTDGQMTDEVLNRALSLDADSLKKRGVDPIRRTFNVGDEKIYCIGGDRPLSLSGKPDVPDTPPISWRCRSAGGLDIATGGRDQDMRQVWGIISGIRKKS